MDRRTFIATTAGVGLASLAGCTTAAGSVAPPQVPESKLQAGGWVKQDEQQGTIFERDYGPVTVTATSARVTYEDAALRESVSEQALGMVDGPLSMFFAARIDFSPDLDDLPLGAGREQLLDAVETQSKAQFEAQLKDVGLENVREDGTGSLAVDTGESASLTRYAADFTVDDMQFPVTEQETITIESQTLTVAGLLAVWHHGDAVLVAGGAHPAENFANQTTHDLTDAISVTVNVDLGLTPEAYEDELRTIVKAVR
ncbi:hypothetical protein ACFQH6_18100 [Halobacteriaceae archaeon GCM10025711]